MIWTCRCGATVSGRAEHCAVESCHLTFATTGAGDKHQRRINGRLVCMSEEWMLSKGMYATANRFGTPIWHLKSNEDAPWLVSGYESDGVSPRPEGQDTREAPSTPPRTALERLSVYNEMSESAARALRDALAPWGVR